MAGRWRDDDRGLAPLDGALSAKRTVPCEFVEAGKATFAWHNIDTELAALADDRTVEDEDESAPTWRDPGSASEFALSRLARPVADPVDDHLMGTMTGKSGQLPIHARSTESNLARRISDADAGVVAGQTANPDDPRDARCDGSSAVAAPRPIRSVIVIPAFRWSAAFKAFDDERDHRALDRRQQPNDPGHIAWLRDAREQPAHTVRCQSAVFLVVARTAERSSRKSLPRNGCPLYLRKSRVLAATAAFCHPDSLRSRRFRTLRSVGEARRRPLDQAPDLNNSRPPLSDAYYVHQH
jgi:hypothetical protein